MSMHPTPSLAEQLAGFPVRHTATALGRIAWRSAAEGAAITTGAAPALVLLHGIGSGSASWVLQLAAARRGALPLPVLAWEAPGYGESEALPMAAPYARDYALRLWAWLDALGVGQVVLVGHSLGALMAAAACGLAPGRVRQLLLLSPAQGYGRAEPQLRQSKLQDRLSALATHGPRGMAERRGAAMLSERATAEQIHFIREVMSHIIPAGYTQAAHMLATGDLQADLQHLSCPLTVASGQADTVTPPAGCEAVAAAAGAPYVSLGAVGHACAVEAGPAIEQLLRRMLASGSEASTPPLDTPWTA